jgi:hypothetical protein
MKYLKLIRKFWVPGTPHFNAADEYKCDRLIGKHKIGYLQEANCFNKYCLPRKETNVERQYIAAWKIVYSPFAPSDVDIVDDLAQEQHELLNRLWYAFQAQKLDLQDVNPCDERHFTFCHLDTVDDKGNFLRLRPYWHLRHDGRPDVNGKPDCAWCYGAGSADAPSPPYCRTSAGMSPTWSDGDVVLSRW